MVFGPWQKELEKISLPFAFFRILNIWFLLCCGRRQNLLRGQGIGQAMWSLYGTLITQNSRVISCSLIVISFSLGWPSSTLLILFTMYLVVQTNMELNRHISKWWWNSFWMKLMVIGERCFSSCHERETKKKSESPWGIEPQTFECRTAMLYHWVTETLRWARSIMKFVWHASCILLGSACVDNIICK